MDKLKQTSAILPGAYDVSASQVSNSFPALKLLSDGSDRSDSGYIPVIQNENNRKLKPFPLDFFPVNVRQALEEIAASINTPIEIPATALISAMGACISRKRAIEPKAGWTEHANLYLVLIGTSGAGKSPAMRKIFKHIHDYEEEKDVQIIADDATLESLPSILKSNPDGILWYRDELTGLFLDFDKYTGADGSTHQRLMSAYNSEPWKVNRADKEKNVTIPHATLSIFGGIQPNSLHHAFSQRDILNGFLPRFLFVAAEMNGPRLLSEAQISTHTDVRIATLITGLLYLDYDYNDVPVVVKLSDEAYDRYANWYNAISLQAFYSDDQLVQNILVQKRHAQCLRLVLIGHCMEAVINQTSNTEPVSLDTMERAISLIDCLATHQEYALNLLVNKSEPSLTPIESIAIKAIIELEPEIENGMLTTKRITEVVNEKLTGTYETKSAEMGKVLSKLGLEQTKTPSGNARGYRITPTVLKDLKGRVYPPSEPSDVSEDES